MGRTLFMYLTQEAGLGLVRGIRGVNSFNPPLSFTESKPFYLLPPNIASDKIEDNPNLIAVFVFDGIKKEEFIRHLISIDGYFDKIYFVNHTNGLKYEDIEDVLQKTIMIPVSGMHTRLNKIYITAIDFIEHGVAAMPKTLEILFEEADKLEKNKILSKCGSPEDTKTVDVRKISEHLQADFLEFINDIKRCGSDKDLWFKSKFKELKAKWMQERHQKQ